ncbi:MAG: rod shape-determining protein MreC [Saprospiraceae bacterium]|nr:rod shape-determining protein MreC [Saprospiraceae bacterium]
MRGLLQFLYANSSFLLFILLEIICFLLIINFNEKQGIIWWSTASATIGAAEKTKDNIAQYFALGKENRILLDENAALRKRLHQLLVMQGDTTVGDSISRENLPALLKDTANVDTSKNEYSFISANVINNSIVGTSNFLTLDKGKRHGIKEDMGVISKDGIVGRVRKVSEHYALVMSILHKDASIIASIRRTGAFGGLQWDGKDARYMYLNNIPRHLEIQMKDTVQTSHHSDIFPKAILIGTVDTFYAASGSNFHTIRVKLNNNLGRLQHAYVIVNKHYAERSDLEAQQPNE